MTAAIPVVAIEKMAINPQERHDGIKGTKLISLPYVEATADQTKTNEKSDRSNPHAKRSRTRRDNFWSLLSR
jgi:hypothetical protein